MRLLYVIVACPDQAALVQLRDAVARPWLQAHNREVRYWVGSQEEAARERAILALAGFSSQIEVATYES